ncbi:MAG TPA: protein kinase [Vicinamibacterales bacterium]|nr:protein kinase [Vicinamibacterales bacterium]
MEFSGLPDRFRLEQEIGRGGMSVVFRAHDAKLNRAVAIKVLSEAYSNAVGIERFQREISVMAKLTHPGIVSLFDSGVARDRLYYVMPLVPGESLRAKLARERRLNVAEALALTADVADALTAAHAAGVVHRDVKPENIFVVSGRAMLADFGIAHVTAPELSGTDTTTAAGGLTIDGMILGTLAYLSPEQAAGRLALDGRSDLYSLGCVLYELLSGSPPFTGTAVALIGQHLTAAPAPLADRGVQVTPDIAGLVDRLLAKDPAERPGDASLVASALRRAPAAGKLSAQPAQSVNVDRLIDEGHKEFQIGTVGGSSSRTHMDQAGVYFRRALAESPRHARALIHLANWHFVMARLGFSPSDDANAKGRELMLAALEADDQVAEVHCSLAKMALYYDDDLHSAERHAGRSVELAPRDPEALRTLSVILKVQGRTAEAIDAARAAVEAAPQMMNALSALADALRVAGQHAEALNVLRRALKIVPGHLPTLDRLAWTCAELGDVDTAVDYRALRLRQSGQADRADQLQESAAHLAAVEAWRRDLLVEVDRLQAQAAEHAPFSDGPTTNSIGDRLALAHSQLGDWPAAVTWIERAYAHRPGRLRRMLMDLPFDLRGLSTERRFVRLLQLAGLEDLVTM